MDRRIIRCAALLVMLRAPDEPRYVRPAGEVSRADSYLIPLMHGEVYAEKRPSLFAFVYPEIII